MLTEVSKNGGRTQTCQFGGGGVSRAGAAAIVLRPSIMAGRGGPYIVVEAGLRTGEVSCLPYGLRVLLNQQFLVCLHSMAA